MFRHINSSVLRGASNRAVFLSVLLLSVSFVSFSAPIRSNIGGEGIEGAPEDSAPTAADYVQDGLVAMWDGIENVGYGRHNDNSSVWVDLVGGRVATLSTHGSFSGQSLVCDGLGNAAADGSPFSVGLIKTVEIGFYRNSGSGIIATVSGNTDTSGIICYITGNEFVAQNVNSVSLGLNNRWRIGSDLGIYQATMLYDGKDFLGAWCNGMWRSSYYTASAIARLNIAFGGREFFTDMPFSGEIFYLRLYNRQLTEDEIAYNNELDKARFGL